MTSKNNKHSQERRLKKKMFSWNKNPLLSLSGLLSSLVKVSANQKICWQCSKNWQIIVKIIQAYRIILSLLDISQPFRTNPELKMTRVKVKFALMNMQRNVYDATAWKKVGKMWKFFKNNIYTLNFLIFWRSFYNLESFFKT